MSRLSRRMSLALVSAVSVASLGACKSSKEGSSAATVPANPAPPPVNPAGAPTPSPSAPSSPPPTPAQPVTRPTPTPAPTNSADQAAIAKLLGKWKAVAYVADGEKKTLGSVRDGADIELDLYLTIERERIVQTARDPVTWQLSTVASRALVTGDRIVTYDSQGSGVNSITPDELKVSLAAQGQLSLESNISGDVLMIYKKVP